MFRAFTGLAMAVAASVIVLGVAMLLDTNDRDLDVLLPWAIGVSAVLTTSVVVWGTRRREASQPQP